MAHTPNLNRIFDTLPAIPKLPGTQNPPSDAMAVRFLVKKPEGTQQHQHQHQHQHSLKPTRRLALGLASIAFFANTNIPVSLAEDNGFWLTGPIPIPQVVNKINNEETGTRSFLKTGVYIADLGAEGRAFRLRKSAFDLLGVGDLLGNDAWNYFRKYLRVKSTFMYYDFDKVISAAPADDKQPLTDLANRLFDNVEKLDDAVKKQNRPETESLYQDATVILQEVMDSTVLNNTIPL